MASLRSSVLIAGLCAMACATWAQTPPGEVKGSQWQHTPGSLSESVLNGNVVLPAKATGAGIFQGKFRDLPTTTGTKVPVVVFLHGSSGNKLAAIGVWQQWLAAQGIASIAPDSFALADRITYTSPVDKTTYEHIHALRESEIAPAAAAVGAQPWADTGKLVLAGTSEGSVAASRYTGNAFAARILYSWSCESNYFVTEPRTATLNIPTLNVISASDPYFSAKNGYLGNPDAKGHCGAALKDNKQASVALIPDAPHTLLNMPATQQITRGFLMSALQLNGRN